MVVINAMQSDISNVHEEIRQFRSILFNEDLDQMQDLGLTPSENVSGEVDIERLCVRSQIVVASNFLGDGSDEHLGAHLGNTEQRMTRGAARIAALGQRQTVLPTGHPPICLTAHVK
jgi:hypothetical protein